METVTDSHSGLALSLCRCNPPVKIGFVNDGFERYVDVVRALRGAGAGVDNFDADPLAIYLISRG